MIICKNLTHNACPSPPVQMSSGDCNPQRMISLMRITQKLACFHKVLLDDIILDSCNFWIILCYGLLKYLWAVVIIASTTSMILWRAESVPIVMSVPQKSLSIDPTMPTMWRAEYFWAASSSIRPAIKNSNTIFYLFFCISNFCVWSLFLANLSLIEIIENSWPIFSKFW